MIIISPAILVDNPADLKHHLVRYVEYGFRSIDIDIQSQPFASAATLEWQSALDLVFELMKSNELLKSVSLGWDVKLTEPNEFIEQLVTQFSELGSHRVYVYQSANVENLIQNQSKNIEVNLGLLDSDELKEIEYYQQFPEIQLMTIASQQQHVPIVPDLLGRVSTLVSMGYLGKISIDGGVNAETANLVRQEPLARVSVGSYFQMARDEDIDKLARRLTELLNPAPTLE